MQHTVYVPYTQKMYKNWKDLVAFCTQLRMKKTCIWNGMICSVENSTKLELFWSALKKLLRWGGLVTSSDVDCIEVAAVCDTNWIRNAKAILKLYHSRWSILCKRQCWRLDSGPIWCLRFEAKLFSPMVYEDVRRVETVNWRSTWTWGNCRCRTALKWACTMWESNWEAALSDRVTHLLLWIVRGCLQCLEQTCSPAAL